MYFYLLLNKDFIIIILLFTSSRKRDRAKMARKCRRKPNVKLLVLLICRARCSLFQALRQWGRRKRKMHANSWRGRKRGKGWERDTALALPMPVSSRFIFVFALSQFSGPDYLGTWNRLCSLPSLLLLLKLPNILSLLDYIQNDWLNKKTLQLPHSFVWHGQLLLLPSPLLSATSLSARVICTFAMFYSPYEIKIIAAFQINLSHQY